MDFDLLLNALLYDAHVYPFVNIFYTNGYNSTVPFYLPVSKVNFPPASLSPTNHTLLSQPTVICFCEHRRYRGCIIKLLAEEILRQGTLTMMTIFLTTTVLTAFGIVLTLFRIWNS